MALQEWLGTTEISGLENEGLEFAGLKTDGQKMTDEKRRTWICRTGK